jgi:hypothetical protein
VRCRFEREPFPDVSQVHPQALADRLLRDFGRETDDATVVVARVDG